jgi:multicomponent Na+:H+ antiporter subunit E
MGSSVTLPNLVLGLALAALVLWLAGNELPVARRVGHPGAMLALAWLFARELVLSALRVARIVLSRDMRLAPGIFAYPLRVRSDGEIALLANLITLTPGTLSVDVSEDGRTLFVHAIDCADPDAARRDVAEGFERRIGEAFG